MQGYKKPFSKYLKLLFGLSIAFLLFFINSKTLAQGECKTGPFNPEGKLTIQDGCPYLSINTKTGEENSTVLRIWAKKTPEEIKNIIKTVNSPYIMPSNEPDIDPSFSDVTNKPKFVAEQIKSILENSNKTALIPALTNNLGSIKSDNYGGGGLFQQIMANLSGTDKSRIRVAVNIYTGVENPLTKLEQMVRGLKTATGLEHPLVITELGIAPGEAAVSGGCMTKSEWLATTAGLQKALYDKGLIGSDVLFAFSALIEASGAQTPVYYNPETQKAYYPGGEITISEMDDALENLGNNKTLASCIANAQANPQANQKPLATCKQPKKLTASPSCVKCQVSSEVQDERNFFRKLLDTGAYAIGTLFNFRFSATLKVADEKKQTPIRALTQKATTIFSSKTSYLSFFFPQAGKFSETNEKEALKKALKITIRDKNGNVIKSFDAPPTVAEIAQTIGYPTIPSISALVHPGKEDKIIADNIYEKVVEKNPGEAKVYIPTASNTLQFASQRVPGTLGLFSFYTNSFAALPVQKGYLSYIPPPGWTEEEYLGRQYAARKNYLAKKRESYLAKNYSDQDIAKLIFNETIRKPKKINTQKNTGKIQKAGLFSNVWNSFEAALCKSPTITPAQVSCKNEQLDVETKVEIGAVNVDKKVNCEQGNPNASCSKPADPSQELQAALVISGLNGEDVAPVEDVGEKITNNVTGSELIKKRAQIIGASNIASTNSQRDIALTASLQKQNDEEWVSGGIIPLMQTISNYLISPIETFNEERSGELPFGIIKTGGAGRIKVPEDAVIPYWKSAQCLDPIAKRTSFTPVAKNKDNPKNQEYERNLEILKYCSAEFETPTPSYCGTSSVNLDNSSGNFEAEIGYADPRAEGTLSEEEKEALKNARENGDFPGSILDDNSNIVLKLATRVVDGATLLVNNTVVPINPGQTSAQRCGGITSGTGVEILYLPMEYAQKALSNPSDLTIWGGPAGRRLAVKGIPGNTNAVYDLRVKPGVYRIAIRTNPCISKGFEVLNSSRPFINRIQANNPDFFAHLTGPFVLEDTVYANYGYDKKAFCAKVTINSNMPGGGYADDSKENQTKAGACTLSKAYDVGLNTACGGLGGTATDLNKWKAVPKPGAEMYKEVFGRNFEIKNSCNSMFPSTIQEVSCDNANNKDIDSLSTYNPGIAQDTTNYGGITLKTPWEAKTNLSGGIEGTATYYAKGVMEGVRRNRIAWGHIKPNQCPECIGYVALLRKGDLGRKVWIKIEDSRGHFLYKKTQTVMGPFLVIDMGARKDIPDLIKKNFVIDLDYKTAETIGMAGRGSITVSVWDKKPVPNEKAARLGSD